MAFISNDTQTICGYELSKKEIGVMKDFLKKHQNCRYLKRGLKDSDGIGTNIYLLCEDCNKFESIADIGKW